nr:hypothetical protein BaRGS_009562 [Batillaria attramentaria]
MECLLRRSDLLSHRGSVFQHDSLVGYTQLVLDEARDQVLVGGRDALFRLSMDDLRVLEQTEWQSSQKALSNCESTGVGLSEDLCHNFVRVLLLHNEDEVFTCGTNAFSPNCTWRPAERLSEVSRVIDGKAICPYDPRHNTTALMTSNEPNFVSTYEFGNFVYFFFREIAVEFINCGKKCVAESGGIKRSSEKSANHLVMAQKYQLMDEAVQPRSLHPMITREHERWTHIVVDHVAGKTELIDVFFLATEDGKIQKMIRLPAPSSPTSSASSASPPSSPSHVTCLVETIKIVPNGHPRPVKAMKLSSRKRMVIGRLGRHGASASRSAGIPWSTNACVAPVHGQWTEWSEWSACSQTCGYGIRSRKRQCGNPPPQYGGRLCVGQDTDKQYCDKNPDCPRWSGCTKDCNGGIQTRRRACDRPRPMREGKMCAGNKQEWRMCNTQECDEIARISPWTEWIQTNRTSGGYFEQRFRFTCRANVPKRKMIKTSYAKSQARFCHNNGHGCRTAGELRNSITSIDTFSSVDRVLRKFCRYKRKLFQKYCNCRTLGVFLVCQKCGYG